MKPWGAHLRLVLHKNFLLRRRQPVILCLEVLWPIVIFLFILAVRHLIPPVERPTCYYHARALPSAGALPFLQSLICNIDNECLSREEYQDIPSYSQARLQDLVARMQPLMSDRQITALVRSLPQGINLMRAVLGVLESPAIQSLLYEGIPVKKLLKSPENVERILREELPQLESATLNAILESRINVPKLVALVGPHSTGNCSAAKLGQFLSLPLEGKAGALEAALCHLTPPSLTKLLGALQTELNTVNIVDMVSSILNSLGQTDLSQALADVGKMTDTLGGYGSELHRIQPLLSAINSGDISLHLLERLITDLEPLSRDPDMSPASRRILTYSRTLLGWIYKRTSDDEVDLEAILSRPRDLQVLASGFAIPLSRFRLLLQTRLSPSLVRAARAASTPQEIHRAFCVKPALTSSSAELTTLQNILCNSSSSQEVASNFRLEVLKSKKVEERGNILEGLVAALKSLDKTEMSPLVPAIMAGTDLLLSLTTSGNSSFSLDRKFLLSSQAAYQEQLPELSPYARLLYFLANTTAHLYADNLEAARGSGLFPTLPYVAETVVLTLSRAPDKWSVFGDPGMWPDLVCDKEMFDRHLTLPGHVNGSLLQELSCRTYRHLAQLAKQLLVHKAVEAEAALDWPGLYDLVAAVAQASPPPHNYDWSRLNQSWDLFFQNLRRQDLANALVNITEAIKKNKEFKFWNDAMAIVFAADRLTTFVNRHLKDVISSSSVEKGHFHLRNSPATDKMIDEVVDALPDLIDTFLETINQDLMARTVKILLRGFNGSQMCESGTYLTDGLGYPRDSVVAGLERHVCRSRNAVVQEIMTQPVVASIMTTVKDVAKKDVNLNWTRVVNHFSKLYENVQSLKNFNGSVFPEAPGHFAKLQASVARATASFDNFKAYSYQRWIMHMLQQVLTTLEEQTVPQEVSPSQAFYNSSRVGRLVSGFKFGLWGYSQVATQLASFLHHLGDDGQGGMFLFSESENSPHKSLVAVLKDPPSVLKAVVELAAHPELNIFLQQQEDLNLLCSRPEVIKYATESLTDQDMTRNLLKITCALLNEKSAAAPPIPSVLTLPRDLAEAWHNKAMSSLSIQLYQVQESTQKLAVALMNLAAQPPAPSAFLPHPQQLPPIRRRFTAALQNAFDVDNFLDDIDVAAMSAVFKMLETYIKTSDHAADSTGLGHYLVQWGNKHLIAGMAALLRTVGSEPQKLCALLDHPSALCNSSLSDFLAVTSEQNLLEKGKQQICQLDFKSILKDNEMYRGVRALPGRLQRRVLGASLGSLLDGLRSWTPEFFVSVLTRDSWTRMLDSVLRNGTSLPDWLGDAVSNFSRQCPRHQRLVTRLVCGVRGVREKQSLISTTSPSQVEKNLAYTLRVLVKTLADGFKLPRLMQEIATRPHRTLCGWSPQDLRKLVVLDSPEDEEAVVFLQRWVCPPAASLRHSCMASGEEIRDNMAEVADFLMNNSTSETRGLANTPSLQALLANPPSRLDSESFLAVLEATGPLLETFVPRPALHLVHAFTRALLRRLEINDDTITRTDAIFPQSPNLNRFVSSLLLHLPELFRASPLLFKPVRHDDVAEALQAICSGDILASGNLTATLCNANYTQLRLELARETGAAVETSVEDRSPVPWRRLGADLLTLLGHVARLSWSGDVQQNLATPLLQTVLTTLGDGLGVLCQQPNCASPSLHTAAQRLIGAFHNTSLDQVRWGEVSLAVTQLLRLAPSHLPLVAVLPNVTDWPSAARFLLPPVADILDTVQNPSVVKLSRYLWLITSLVTERMNSTRELESLATKELPAMSAFIDNFVVPNFPLLLTTAIWTSQVEPKVAELAQSATLVLCQRPLKHGLYNPALSDAQWSLLQTQLCTWNLAQIAEELQNFHIQQGSPRWQDVTQQLSEMVQKAEALRPPSSDWNTTLHDFMRVSRDPAVLLYLSFNKIFHPLCDMDLPNRPLRDLLCHLGSEAHASHALSELPEFRTWNSSYEIINRILHLEDFIGSLWGDQAKEFLKEVLQSASDLASNSSAGAGPLARRMLSSINSILRNYPESPFIKDFQKNLGRMLVTEAPPTFSEPGLRDLPSDLELRVKRLCPLLALLSVLQSKVGGNVAMLAWTLNNTVVENGPASGDWWEAYLCDRHRLSRAVGVHNVSQVRYTLCGASLGTPLAAALRFWDPKLLADKLSRTDFPAVLDEAVTVVDSVLERLLPDAAATDRSPDSGAGPVPDDMRRLSEEILQMKIWASPNPGDQVFGVLHSIYSFLELQSTAGVGREPVGQLWDSGAGLKVSQAQQSRLSLLLKDMADLVEQASELSELQLHANLSLPRTSQLLESLRVALHRHTTAHIRSVIRSHFLALRVLDALSFHSISEVAVSSRAASYLTAVATLLRNGDDPWSLAITKPSFWRNLLIGHLSLLPLSAPFTLLDLGELQTLVQFLRRNQEVLPKLCDSRLQGGLFPDGRLPDWHTPALKFYCFTPLDSWQAELETGANLTALHQAATILLPMFRHELKTNITLKEQFTQWNRNSVLHFLEDAVLRITASVDYQMLLEAITKEEILQAFVQAAPEALGYLDEEVCSRLDLAPPLEIARSNAALKVIQGLPDAETLLCEMPNMTLSSLYHWASQSLGLKSILKTIQHIKLGDLPTSQKCASYYAPVAAAAAYLQDLYGSVMGDPGRLESCRRDIPHGRLWTSMKKYSSFLKNLYAAAQPFLNSSDENSVTDFLEKQIPVYTSLHQLAGGSSELIAELQSPAFNITKDSLWPFLNTSLNLNWLSQHNFSRASLEQALCQDRRAVRGIAREPEVLCRHRAAVAYILDHVDSIALTQKLSSLQRQRFRDGSWLRSLLIDGETLLSRLAHLGGIGAELTAGSNQLIARLFNAGMIDHLLTSLEDLTDTLTAAFPGSPLVEKLQVVVNGVRGLQVLQRHRIFDISYKVRDLFSNSTALHPTLESELELTHAQVEALLNTELNLTALGSRQFGHELLCQDPRQLSQLLSTSLDPGALHSAFCSRSARALQRSSSRLLSELALTRVFNQVTQLGAQGVLARAELDWAQARSAVELLKSAPLVAPRIQRHVGALLESLDPETMEHILSLNISTDGLQLLATPQALNAAGRILCGKPLRALQNEFKLLQVAPKNTSPKLDSRERSVLPSEFCRAGYEQVMRMAGGPLVWGFLKPVLRGKILYAPDNTKTRSIMAKINSTFDGISDFLNILQAWSEGAHGIQYLQQRQDTLERIKELAGDDAIRPLVEQFIGKETGDLLNSFNVPDIGRQLGNMSGLLNLVQMVGNMSRCFELSRFQGHATEEELVKAATQLNLHREFIAAVVFLNLEDDGTENTPSHIKYKIRMDIDNVPSTLRTKSRFWRPGPRDNFLEDLRYFRGFVQLQELVDSAIHGLADPSVARRSTYLQQFPYPCYRKDEFGYFLKSTLPILYAVGWIFVVAFLIRERVLERELRLEDLLGVMGLSPHVNLTAWFLSGTANILVGVSIITVILTAGGIFPFSNPVIVALFLLLYSVYLLMFCYLMSALFKTATLASLTALILYLISSVPFIMMLTLEGSISFHQKLASCLVLATSFCFGSTYLTRFEDQGVGIQWDNIWLSQTPGDPMCFAWVMIMMAVGSILYFLVGWYISSFVNNGGVVKTKKQKSRAVEEEKCCTEKIAARSHVGISIRNLRVVYSQGSRPAVADLSLDLLDGQVTTLLGQNGAGKTTTINVMTGQLLPTSGTVTIYGRKIPEQLPEARKLIGYCPQYNTLFSKMTMREHLKFYGSLKGILSKENLEKEIDDMLESMGLQDRQHELACHLSGGLQRRLCVALAFIGGSRLIVLDEPTSSVDPVARRSIWDLILKYRHGRTILLTTHHMDEADLLSDSVAIVHQGRLLCAGSPLLLKHRFGCGYQLTLTRQGSDADSDSGRASSTAASTVSLHYKECGGGTEVSFIQNLIPNALVLEEHSSELVVSLPQCSSDGRPHRFSAFFRSLDEALPSLGFTSYGLSSTTLEEVFLTLTKLEEIKMNHRNEFAPPPAFSLKEDCGETGALDLGSLRPRTGLALKCQQLQALLLKRFYHTARDWRSLLCTIVMPCVFIALAMGFTLLKPEPFQQPSLIMDPVSLYGPQPITFIGTHDSTPSFLLKFIYRSPLSCQTSGNQSTNCPDDGSFSLPTLYPTTGIGGAAGCMRLRPLLFHPSHSRTPDGGVVYDLSNVSVTQYLLTTYTAFADRRYGGWTEAQNGAVKVWYDNTGFHSAPAFLNSLSNALLRSTLLDTGRDPRDYGITTYNHPLQLTREQLGRDTIVHRVAELGVALVFLLGFGFIPSSFAMNMVRERVREERRLQRVGGVGPLLYWGAALTWDMGLVCAATGLAAVIMLGFSIPLYTARLNLPAVVALLLLFGWATTPLMYLMEGLFSESSISFMVLFSMNVFLGLTITIGILILSLFSYSQYAREMVGSTVNLVALAFPQYALVGSLFDLAKNNLQADIFAMFGQDTYINPFSFEAPLGLGPAFVWLAVDGVVFFCLTLLLDYSRQSGRWLRWGARIRLPAPPSEDSDVEEERQRVHGAAARDDLLRLVDVSHVYRARRECVAVDGLNLAVPRGECFGLLGVNGAGKTTLFRILTGQLRPSGGEVFINGKKVCEVVDGGSQMLGYCPQSDALDDLLTPAQHLKFHALIRGVPHDEVRPVVARALAAFQLQRYIDCPVGTLSRGTRRKVCTAIAMLGNPSLILLDEPTTGMDPLTRRLVWSNVQRAVRNQCSVILTSHSMEECDILCSRLAIMVNGKLRCLGGPQYLKYKFGTGYTIALRLEEGEQDWTRVYHFIQSHFPTARIRSRHCTQLELSLPSQQDMSLSDIFLRLESLESETGVKDIAVSQTSLDQVFVSFAQQQGDGSVEPPNPLPPPDDDLQTTRF